MMTFRDGLGVAIEVGDRVIITAWGDGPRLADVRTKGTVTGFARTRLIVSWDAEQNGPIGNIHPAYVTVARRDGEPGFQGNVVRPVYNP